VVGSYLELSSTLVSCYSFTLVKKYLKKSAPKVHPFENSLLRMLAQLHDGEHYEQ